MMGALPSHQRTLKRPVLVLQGALGSPLPLGEGEGEGGCTPGRRITPLTPTLSQGEREPEHVVSQALTMKFAPMP